MLEPKQVNVTGKSAARDVARFVAFYLPQFHQIPENDAWWGQGFTEWTNVRKARPLFPGHRQPREPGGLGYYDLRDPEARNAQAFLADQAGIEGFCYWHYWFGNGDRILEMPVNEILRTGEPEFPFCLCWANESWTGVWHGAPRRVLKQQNYPGMDDDIHHFEELLPAFTDRRYMKVKGKPIFLVYKPHLLPRPGQFVDVWNTQAIKHGFAGMHFIGMASRFDEESLRFFDQVTPIAPSDFLNALPERSTLKRALRYAASGRFGEWLGGRLCKALDAPLCYDYSDVVEHALRILPRDERHVPCVVPGWDNTPRVGRRGMVLENSTPELFRRYVHQMLERATSLPADRRFVFIKAWNEWAEGNFLEPAADTGNRFLDALHDEIQEKLAATAVLNQTVAG